MSSDQNYHCQEDPCCKDLGIQLYRENIETGELLAYDLYVARYHAGEIQNIKEWRETSRECPCQEKAREQRKMDRILGSSRLSPKFKKRTFERIVWLDPEDWEQEKDREAVAKLMASQQKAYKVMLHYTKHWPDLAMGGYGVGLYGDPGVAKTHLLAAKTLRLLEMGYQSVFVNTSEIFDEIRKTFETDESGAIKKVRSSEIIDLITNAQDLSLDDIGTERPTPYVLECFYNIINHRYEWELPTSFSTNLSDEELKAHLRPKTHRRLIEPAAGRCCMIKGPSFERILLKLSPEKREKYCNM